MRKLYLDNVRWIIAVLVVLYHVIYMFNGVETAGVIGAFSNKPQYQDLFLYIVYPWFMLLLFVVSGMSARMNLERALDSVFIRSRTRKLLVPSTIGVLVFHWLPGYYNLQISNAFSHIGNVPKPVLYIIMCLSGIGPLWFIQLLWLFSMLLVMIRRIEKDVFYNMCSGANVLLLLSLILPIWGAAQVLNMPIVSVYRIGIYGVAFLIGYFILSHEKVQERLEKWWIVLGTVAFVLMICFCMVYWRMPYAHHEVLGSLLCNVYAWISVLACIAFMKKFGNFDNAFCRFMKKRSWGLYILHYLPLAMCAWYVRNHIRYISPALVYAVMTCIAFLGAFILDIVISKIPMMKYCVLGIKEKRKIEDV